MLDPGGGIAVYGPGGVAGGEGSCITGITGTTGIEAGSFKAIPKSVNFHVFVLAEYKTDMLTLSGKGDSTILRFDITMSKVEIVTSLNTFHDIADNFPNFRFCKVGFLFVVSFSYISCQIR